MKAVPFVRTAQWYGAHVLIARLPDIRKRCNKIHAEKTTSEERVVLLMELEKDLRLLTTLTRRERLGLKAELKGEGNGLA